MKKKLVYIMISVLLVCFATKIFANDLQISNVEMVEINTESKYAYISFNLSYNNAWRINTGAANWSAVWVFVKYRLSDGIWKHATLNTNAANHKMPINVQGDPSGDGKGIFIYDNRENPGNFHFEATGIELRCEYGIDNISELESSIDIRVFGIEMVYIPEGSFYLGSDDQPAVESNMIYKRGSPNTPFQVNNENEILVGNTTNYLYYNNDNSENSGDRSGPIPAAYPKGYQAFYLMRYEITQEQYCDFLNTLTRAQQNTRTESDVSGNDVSDTYVMSYTSSISYRNSIRCNPTGHGTTNPVFFFCDYNGNLIPNEEGDGQNIACNYLNFEDGKAYMDWACLRPMTETEFEKAARGPVGPASWTYVWGETTITPAPKETLTNPGASNENNTTTGDGLCNYNDESSFPYRSGFAAIAGNNRPQSGTGFYGNLDLGGNLYESCITIGSPAGRQFDGRHGDGSLTASGNADVVNWPNRFGQSFRGGAFNRTSERVRISDRFRGLFDTELRYINATWRGARTAD
jgi:formylglycine-generating enzyme required for sulfatase activity